MASVSVQKRINILLWSEIEKWTSTSSLLRFGKLPPGWQMLFVHEFASQIYNKETVDPEKEYKMAGVRWYGEGVFHRETVSGKEQSAAYLSPLKTNAFIYNRLFAWKESFAVVTSEAEDLYVSNEFPQFEIDETIVLPEYVYLLFNSRKLIRAVNAASIGSSAVSRNRFKESDFLGFKVPIPPPPTQQKIVSYWKKAHQKIKHGQKAQNDLISELNDYMIPQTRKYKLLRQSKLFSASFSHTPQWDVKAGRAAVFKEANPSFVRLGDYTEECAEMIKPWEYPDKLWPIYGVNNKDGVFLSTKQETARFNAAYKRIEKNWFFHNPTRANVGSLGIVPEVPDDAITSPEYQVWKLTGGFEPEFMDLLLQTQYFLTLVSFNRVGGVKQRMYYANLAEIRLPMISPDTQNDYIKRKAAIKENLKKAATHLIEVKKQIEKLILGTLSVEEL